MKSVFEQQNNYKKTYYIWWEHQVSRSFKQNSYVIVRIKPTQLNTMKLLVGFATYPETGEYAPKNVNSQYFIQ